ncbi:MAG: cytochrome c [Thiobacillus sp.]|nr:cytochrome c [Thiobacillus sp.]
MKTLITLVISALFAANVHAAPFAKGDPLKGKALHDKSCTSCHVGMFGGDGSKMYTRPDHKIKTAQQLSDRISACNTNTGAGWFPEDEAHVAAYLNQHYYKFK